MDSRYTVATDGNAGFITGDYDKSRVLVIDPVVRVWGTYFGGSDFDNGNDLAVDDEGNPVYQGIDQAKLVPLLVAAVQELSARVAALEAN